MTAKKVLTPSLFHAYFGEPETIWQRKRRNWGVTGTADLGSVWPEIEENLRARPEGVTKCTLLIAQTVPMAGVKALHLSSV